MPERGPPKRQRFRSGLNDRAQVSATVISAWEAPVSVIRADWDFRELISANRGFVPASRIFVPTANEAGEFYFDLGAATTAVLRSHPDLTADDCQDGTLQCGLK
jgi:hypothetical protein